MLLFAVLYFDVFVKHGTQNPLSEMTCRFESDPRDQDSESYDSPKPQALHIKGLGLCRFWRLCF